MKPAYKIELHRSELGADQYVCVPNSSKEMARPATECEVSLWKAWEMQRRINERILAGNRVRFTERLKRGHHISLAVLAALVLLPTAHAQFACTTCATEPTQWLNHAQLVVQVAKTVAILENAIQQSKMMGFNGNGLGLELGQITNVLQAGQALNQATANLQQRWDGTWGTPPAIPVTLGFHADYTRWNATAQNSLRAAMLAGQLSHIQQSNAVGILTQIEGFLNVLDSRNKAIQTTAAGTMRTASSVEKMHDTILSQGAAQQVFMQYQLQKDMQQQALEQQFFAPATVPRDNKGY